MKDRAPLWRPKVKHCKDCPPTSTRNAKYPGPRCATHHRERNKILSKRAHEARVIANYKLSAGEYDERYKTQGGKCAICRWATGATKKLAVDHNHTTGMVRGLLCGPCNQFLGRMGDDPEAFLRAYKYLLGQLEYNSGGM